jgi:hypothetical protein
LKRSTIFVFSPQKLSSIVCVGLAVNWYAVQYADKKAVFSSPAFGHYFVIFKFKDEIVQIKEKENYPRQY